VIVLEHAAPTAAVAIAGVVALGLAVASFRRDLPRGALNGALLAARVAFLLLLLWCLLLPERRTTIARALKPRFAVALDVSRSMRLAPSPAVSNRWQNAATALRSTWVPTLRRECEVDVYPFAAKDEPRLDPEVAAVLTPDGEATRLRDSLRRVADRYRGQTLAGLLLLSDGHDTAEATADWVREAWPCPIYTVALEPPGLWEAEPELRIDLVHTPRRVTVGWNSELKATVSGQGTRGRAVNVQLFRGVDFVRETVAQLPAEGGARDVTFKLEHPTVGSFVYRVVAPPLRGESVTNDNAYSVSVQVVDAQNRLLYVEGPPRWESKFLSRALKANRQITPVCFYRGPENRFLTLGEAGGLTADMTESELALCKIVVLGNLDAEALGPRRPAALVKFVESGGSLVLLGGGRAWGEAGFTRTALKPVLPVKQVSATPLEARMAVSLTPEGQAHPAFGGDKAAWETVPPVLSVFPDVALSPGAQTLAVAATARGAQPVVVAQPYGQGKVVALLTDSLWRWQLDADAAVHQPYQRFWDQLLVWLSPSEKRVSEDQMELFTDKERVFLGESLAFSAHLGGRDKPPPTDGPVQCEIRTPDGRVAPYEMAARQVVTPSGKSFPGSGCDFKAEAPGLHAATAVATVAGRRVASDPVTFFVRPYTPELVPRPCNTEVLTALARQSGGKHFATVEQMNNALASLRFEAGKEESVEYASLWQRWPVVACLLLLLCLEWAARKWRNLP
jgi:hypothetical protein